MGVYLSQPNKEKHFSEGSGQGLTFCSAEMQGWRKTMEDADIHQVDIGQGNSLFAVFDGHGGYQVSQYVKRIFVKQLTSEKLYINKKYSEALKEVFKNVDQRIKSPEGQKQLRKIRSDNSGMATETANQSNQFIGGSIGCTANVVLITPTFIYAANAGDSRSVLCQDGKAFNLSEDHKPESPEEEARIKKAGGVIAMGRVNGGLNLTRSFGDFDYKQNKTLPYNQQMITCDPDVKQFPRKKGSDQFILQGCDGIWERYVDNSQGLIDKVKQSINKDKNNHAKIVGDMLEDLIASETTSGIGCDNMTALLIVFNN